MDSSSRSGLVLADDTTGALECASLLAGAGMDAGMEMTGGTDCAIRIVDTASRHLAPGAARERIGAALVPGADVFKKTDSTLRGNIGAEIAALLEARPGVPVVYLPAYPAVGRTVRNGHLYVGGRRVSETAFAADPSEPVVDSAVAHLFSGDVETRLIADAGALADALQAPRSQVLICDAVTGSEMDGLAAVIAQSGVSPWVASPAGFIVAWARGRQFRQRTPPARPHVRRWLIVCGSLHPQSRRQAGRAAEAGIPVLATANGPEPYAIETLAEQTGAYIGKHRPEAILIMGGDTVRAIWKALGIRGVVALPELLPGIAACLAPRENFLFVTKAGGFGEDNLVEQILEICR